MKKILKNNFSKNLGWKIQGSKTGEKMWIGEKKSCRWKIVLKNEFGKTSENLKPDDNDTVLSDLFFLNPYFLIFWKIRISVYFFFQKRILYRFSFNQLTIFKIESVLAFPPFSSISI